MSVSEVGGVTIFHTINYKFVAAANQQPILDSGHCHSEIVMSLLWAEFWW